MNFVLAAVAAFALIGGVATALPEPAKTPDVIEAAAGNGTYSDDDRYFARLILCQKIVEVQLSPEAFNTFTKDKNFTADGRRKTADICTAESTGYAVGFKAGVASDPKRIA